MVVTVLVVGVVGAVNFKAAATAFDAALVAALRENPLGTVLLVVGGGIGANDNVAALVAAGGGAAVVPIKFNCHDVAAAAVVVVTGGRSK